MLVVENSLPDQIMRLCGRGGGENAQDDEAGKGSWRISHGQDVVWPRSPDLRGMVWRSRLEAGVGHSKQAAPPPEPAIVERRCYANCDLFWIYRKIFGSAGSAV